MPPKLGQVRRGVSPASTEMLVARQAGDAVLLPTPLFWDSIAWDTWPPLVAQAVCKAMGNRGVLVSALQSELGIYPESSIDSEDNDERDQRLSLEGLPRMLPYRNERYGLAHEDFDQCAVVDVHLSPPRDTSGRFAYSAARLGRWEGTPDDEPLSGGGWIPAMTLPPDVPDGKHLLSKVQQVRSLAENAAVIVSATPEWLEDCLDDLLAAQPDALFLRMGQLRMNGLDLACFVQRVVKRVKQKTSIPIWLTPPRSLQNQSLSVSDSIKIVALGISAIAIDSWMGEVNEELDEIDMPSSYAAHPEQQVLDQVEEILERLFDPSLESFIGLYSTLVHDRPADLLGSFDPGVAKLLGLPCLGQL